MKTQEHYGSADTRQYRFLDMDPFPIEQLGIDFNPAHEFNLDAAQHEIDRRALEGEDMSRASIDPKTYRIIMGKTS